jgi:hypothetical protein
VRSDVHQPSRQGNHRIGSATPHRQTARWLRRSSTRMPRAPASGESSPAGLARAYDHYTGGRPRRLAGREPDVSSSRDSHLAREPLT